MKITSLILIAALGTPILATPDRSDKDHHKQTYARQQFNGGLRKLLHEEHLPTQSRIVGGSDAAVGQFPFFVDWSGCGASLIHKDIILTAAHCFGVGTNTVYVGSSRRYGGVADRGIERTITKKNIHPLYDDRTVNYDYLVMKLNAPVDGITPVQLNDEGTSPFNNEELTVIGYGATGEGESGTSVLQEANVNYIPTGNCNVNYSGEINGATMMCGGVGGGIDSCQGDSGGPIFIENDDDTFKQVGIVSWGYGCARPEYPGVYSRVSGQVDWIKAQICALSDFKPDYCNASDDGGDGDSDGGAGEGEVTVRFDITYDQYPTENSWSVQKGQTTVINKNVGELTIAGLVSEKFKLSSGSHTFQINDSFSDGICCAFGQGRYEIYAEIGGTDVLLLSSAGDFGALDRKEFIVPGANGSPSASAPTPAAATPAPTRASREPTSAPTPNATPAPTPEAATLAPTPVVATPAPTESPVAEQPPLGCTDSTTPMSIFINDVIGTQDCRWLGDNLNNFSYLCRFLDVAAACKVTCSACQYFVN